MRTVRGLAAALVMLAVAGCAQRTDWIEGTLVTVDVSGLWRGPVARGLNVGGELELNLVQSGAKVTGQAQMLATKFSIEGTVRGDVFSFREPGGRLHGEATVSGDAMAGWGWTNISVTSAQSGRFSLKLSRQP